jgi:hypothetical protein
MYGRRMNTAHGLRVGFVIPDFFSQAAIRRHRPRASSIDPAAMGRLHRLSSEFSFSLTSLGLHEIQRHGQQCSSVFLVMREFRRRMDFFVNAHQRLELTVRPCGILPGTTGIFSAWPAPSRMTLSPA